MAGLGHDSGTEAHTHTARPLSSQGVWGKQLNVAGPLFSTKLESLYPRFGVNSSMG